MAKKKPVRTPRKTQAAGPPLGTVYANHVTSHWGAAEIVATFSQTHPTLTPTDGTTWPIVEVGRVILSPQLAKILVFQLTTSIAIYEGLLGRVTLARPLIPKLPDDSVITNSDLVKLAALHAQLFPEPSTDAPAASSRPAEPEPVKADRKYLADKITRH